MKHKIKQFIQRRLEKRTKQFFEAHPNIKLIAITGSVGKTSTKMAVAKMLSQKYRVLVHEENHNMELSVPLTLMKIPYPQKVRSVFQWLLVLGAARRRVKQPFPYDIIIAELGTDKPGDIAAFGRYLKPDIAIVTAVSPEHMEFFKTIDAVAKDELSIGAFSKLVVINRDDIDEGYAGLLEATNIDTYGMGGVAEYHFLPETSADDGFTAGKIVSPEFGEQEVKLQVIGEHSVKPIIAGALVGIKMGLSAGQVASAAESILPVPGRMQLLRGMQESLLIDDTYNSSPLAAKAALQTLYGMSRPQRVAILGSMNELGEFSKQAHEEVGHFCDPSLLDWVVTIGDEAEKYLAPAAASRGCQVRSFKNPYDAGGFVHSVLQTGAVVLAKGSQNGVFAEEALKVLLHSTSEEERLVRQSVAWMAQKRRMFSKF